MLQIKFLNFRNTRFKKYIYLIQQISLSNLRKKDQSTWLGFFWILLSPMIMMTILYFLFRDRSVTDRPGCGGFFIAMTNSP